MYVYMYTYTDTVVSRMVVSRAYMDCRDKRTHLNMMTIDHVLVSGCGGQYNHVQHGVHWS